MNNFVSKIFNKKYIFTVITSSAFITGCTISVIWFYLSYLGRLDIFFDAASISSALGIIFCFVLLSLMGFSLVIFASSFILTFIYQANEDKFNAYTSMSHRISSICYLNSLFISFLIISGYAIHYYFHIKGYLVTLVCFAAIIAFSYILSIGNLFYAKTFLILFSKKNLLAYGSEEAEKLPHDKWLKYSLPLLLLTPGIVQIFPMLLLFPQINFSEGTSNLVELLMLYAFSFAIVTIGILPGSLHLNERKNGKKLTSILIGLASIPLTIAVLGVWYRPMPDMIINMAMNLSGISDWRPHNYYIENNTHPHGMFNNTLWNTRYYKDIPERFFITGISAFTFGNIKLICPYEVARARVENFKVTINDLDKEIEKGKKLKVAAMKCIPFDKNEIHTWDSPIPEPIYYGKVKVSIDNSMLKILHSLK